MKDMKRGTFEFLCPVKEATPPYFPQWTVRGKELVKYLTSVIVIDCKLGSAMRLPRAEIFANKQDWNLDNNSMP